MKLHCPHSRWSMTRNSIKGLVMQMPSIIYIRTGFYCVGISWAELCMLGLVRTIWIAQWHLGRGANYQRVLIHLSCPTDSVCLFVCATEDQIPHGFPNIDMGPQLKVVERTRTATMLCAASGNPDPEIYWFKDFLPVDISSSNGRIKQLRSGTAPVHKLTHRSQIWKEQQNVLLFIRIKPNIWTLQGFKVMLYL